MYDFGWTLRLLPYFMCANSKGSGEIAQMCRLAWAFADRLCDKYHNLMSWLTIALMCCCLKLPCLSSSYRKNQKNGLVQFARIEESTFLVYPPGFLWARPGLGNVILHDGCKTTLVHDFSMMILRPFLMSWHHFHVSFHQTFRRQT